MGVESRDKGAWYLGDAARPQILDPADVAVERCLLVESLLHVVQAYQDAMVRNIQHHPLHPVLSILVVNPDNL